MRRWLVALCLIGFASHASANEFDLPVLRGSSPFIPATPKYTRWAGFYIGGQVGHGSTEMNFAGATQSQIAYLLRTTALESDAQPSQWGVLGTATPNTTSVGAFAGYNSQWDDVIIGFDVHYNRGNFFGQAPVTPITRVVSAGGNTYNVTVTGDGSMRITDFGVSRLRAGWIVNNFLPYGTLGFAVARADVTRSARVYGAESPPVGYPAVPCDPLAGCVAFDFSTSQTRNSMLLYGWAAGGGMDILLMPNFFVRAEYEYIGFAKTWGISEHMHTARVGAGFKF